MSKKKSKDEEIRLRQERQELIKIKKDLELKDKKLIKEQARLKKIAVDLEAQSRKLETERKTLKNERKKLANEANIQKQNASRLNSRQRKYSSAKSELKVNNDTKNWKLKFDQCDKERRDLLKSIADYELTIKSLKRELKKGSMI